MAEITWKLYSPLNAAFFPKDEYGNIDIREANAVPLNGAELTAYGDSIRKAIGQDFEHEDLSDFIRDDLREGNGVLLKRKVLSIVPTAETVNGELMGCSTVKLCKPLTDEETAALCAYLKSQYVGNWGEDFEQKGIMAESGMLFVYFWQREPFVFTIDRQTPAELEKTAEQAAVQPQRPKMALAGMDGSIFLRKAATRDERSQMAEVTWKLYSPLRAEFFLKDEYGDIDYSVVVKLFCNICG